MIHFKRMAELTADQSLAVLTDGHQPIGHMVDAMNAKAVAIPCMRGKTIENVLHEIWDAMKLVGLGPGRMSLTVADRVGPNAMMRHWHLDVSPSLKRRNPTLN